MKREPRAGGEPKFQKSNRRFSSKNRLGLRPTSVRDDRLSPLAANLVIRFETFPIVARGDWVETGLIERAIPGPRRRK